MRTPTRFTRRVALVAALALVLALVPTGGFAAADESHNTCKDHPLYDVNYEGNTSGAWGSITFRPDRGPLVLDVNEGHEVFLCLKKGSDSSDMGLVEVGPFTGPLAGVEVNFPGTNPADGFSHYGLRHRDVGTTTTAPTTTVPETTTTVAATTTVAETTTTVPETTTTVVETTTTVADTTTTTDGTDVGGIDEQPTTTAAPTTAAPTTAAPTTAAPTTAAPTTAAPTTEEAQVLGRTVTRLPRTGNGTSVATLGLVTLLLGGVLVATTRRQALTR